MGTSVFATAVPHVRVCRAVWRGTGGAGYLMVRVPEASAVPSTVAGGVSPYRGGSARTSSVHRAPAAVRATSRPYALSTIVIGAATEPVAVAPAMSDPSGGGL